MLATVARLSVVVATLILVTPLATDAQQAAKVYRIGYLSSGPSASNLFVEPFRQGLRAHGWAEGQNVTIDYRFAEGRFDRLPALAAELVRLKVDVIVAAPTPPTVAAKNATGTIPIVMVGAGDPVGLRLVASLARPGGNVTGLAFSVGFDTVVKALELLRETVPSASRVAILSNPANPGNVRAVRELRAAGHSLGVHLQFLEVRNPGEFDAAFAAMVKERVVALLVVSDSMFVLHRARLADLADKHRLPSVYGARENVEAGGLMSYGVSVSDLHRRAATFVDKILKGAAPADLPVEQPTKFELVINLKTAKGLGLMIPQSMLVRADEIVE